MKRAELEAMGLTKEQIDVIMKTNGDDINNAKKNNVDPEELKRLQDIEIEHKKLQDAGLSDAEKIQKALKEAEETKALFATAKNKLDAEKILLDAGLTSEDYSPFIEGLVSDDADKTKDLVSKLATSLKAKLDATEAKVKEDLLNNTGTPDGQGGGEEKSQAVKIAEKLAEDSKGGEEEQQSIISNYK